MREFSTLSHRPRMIAQSENSGSITSVVGKCLGAVANDIAAREGCQVALYQERCRTVVKMSVQPGEGPVHTSDTDEAAINGPTGTCLGSSRGASIFN